MAELTNVAFFRAKSGQIRGTRHEPGSLRYEIHQSTVTGEDWIVVEDWRYASDFDEHMKSSYVRDFLARVSELCVGDVENRGFQQRSRPYE